MDLLDPRTAKTYEKLKEIRKRTDLKLKPTPYLKDTFTGFDGEEHPLTIRYYQVQMVLHLVAMTRFLVGDDTGLGKTLETISGLCYVWASSPDTKAVILTTKSATPQWGSEFEKFTHGVTPYVCQGTPNQRKKVRDAFEAHCDGPAVIVMGYRTAVQDFKFIQDWEGFVLVTDEATAYKNPKTQVHQVVEYLASRASRVWALTATLIKNNLMEGYGIYRVVQPNIFQMDGKLMSATQFMYYFCIVETMALRRGPRVPRVVGYYPDKVKEFRDLIDPYYLGRPKHQVADELPSLTMRTIEVGLTPEQRAKYREALTGLLTVGESTGVEEDKEVTKLTAITYCQQIVNHPALIDCEGDSEKLTALIDLLKDGDLAGEKVIIFTRFKKMVNLLMPVFEKQIGKGKAVRITGDENGEQRQAAKVAFQNPKSDTNIVCITMAGSDAINLQAAKAIIFYDTPFSAGDYLQILGRMIRIGSTHDKVYAIHLVAKGHAKTVDHRVLDILSKKMDLLESVLGKRLKGDGGGNGIIQSTGDVNDLFEALKADAKGVEDEDGMGKGGVVSFPDSTKEAVAEARVPPAPTEPEPTPLVEKFEGGSNDEDDLFSDWD
jgi:SNF2 family DNA or RNA helicase